MSTQPTTQITSEAMRAKMKLPPAMQGPYQRVVLAGQKIMYSQQMAPQIQALMKGPGTMGDKIGQAVVALIALLIDQSNHTLPPQLIVPSGVEFCTDFAALLRQAGQQVTDQDVAAGMEAMVSQVMQKLGVTPEKLGALAKGQPVPGAQPQQPTPQPQPAAAPAQPAAPAAAGTSVATDASGN